MRYSRSREEVSIYHWLPRQPPDGVRAPSVRHEYQAPEQGLEAKTTATFNDIQGVRILPSRRERGLGKVINVERLAYLAASLRSRSPMPGQKCMIEAIDGKTRPLSTHAKALWRSQVVQPSQSRSQLRDRKLRNARIDTGQSSGPRTSLRAVNERGPRAKDDLNARKHPTSLLVFVRLEWRGKKGRRTGESSRHGTLSVERSLTRAQVPSSTEQHADAPAGSPGVEYWS
ncbi:hypothetical protein NMY22_g11391 [Coprinellus aureogranulatus]|nr:hypothetical protein NMY22_g11391 [Coprinellus aureogranulatus]